MPLLPQQLARSDGASFEVRDQPLRLNWLFEDLVSSDAHRLRVRFACSVGIADTASDRRMFREVFLGSRANVMADDVIAHFGPSLRKAAADLAPSHTAEDWIRDKGGAMQGALVSAGKTIAFACGLEVLAPFDVQIESPSLERHRLESSERARAEARVAGQVQHFQRAAELLREFQSLREQMPDLSPSQLLAQINPVDRGTTLHSLLIAGSRQGRDATLWAVAGPYLVRIDPSHQPPRAELIPLPTEQGPLRSVQPTTLNGRAMLLVGARQGVMVVPAESPAEAQAYRDPRVQTHLGFNRAVARGGEIWASHGEAGVVGWKLGQHDEPIARFSANPDGETDAMSTTPAPSAPPPSSALISMGGSPSLMTTAPRGVARPQGPRNLQVLDDSHLLYSVGHELVVLARDAQQPQALPSESTAEVIALLPGDERSMYVVHADSTIVVLSRQTRQVVDRQRRAGRVCAAGALPWLGTVRLLLVDVDGPVDCVGFADPLITQYMSNHRGLRVVAACADFVAALSSDRQRVVLWQSWDGRAPVAEIHVTGLARHRVADVEFG